MYIGGMSSSLPEDVQYAMYRTVPGLEHAKIVRNAYAIEYDCINPRQLILHWSLKISGLVQRRTVQRKLGYEEAACTGTYAGINAAMKVKGKKSRLILDRSRLISAF